LTSALAHPVLPLLAAALAVAVLPRRAGAALAVAAPLASLWLLLVLDRTAERTVGFYGYELEPLRLDALAAPFAYAFVAIAALAGLYGARVMGRTERAAALVHAASGLGVVLAGDLLTLFVVWEIKAVAGAVMIAAGGRPGSRQAAMRYLLIHVVGGSLLLAGVVWHLSGGGSLTFDQTLAGGAGVLVLVAFALSAAVPPLHAWLPDAYPAASVAGTVVLSAFTTKSAVYALARAFPGTEALVILGVAMALYGVVFAMLADEVRRLLSYHIVSQVGFMVAAVGVGTAAAVNGATAHAVAHIFYKGLLLMGVGAVVHATGREALSRLGGLGKLMPAVMVLYLVGAFSISGVPLFSGFVSKEMAIHAAGIEGRDVVVQLLKLASVGTFLSTTLKLPWFTWGGPDRGPRPSPVPATMVGAMVVVAAMNVAIGVQPGLLYDVLPHPVDYAPFEAGKVAAALQLLGISAVVFVLLVRRSTPEPKLVLDVDWLYRVPPRRILRRIEATDEVMARRAARLASRVRGRLSPPEWAAAGPPRVPTVAPTTALGAIMLATFVLTLGWSLL
jgi:multicomponent Na+:H+ antiporter subunit D